MHALIQAYYGALARRARREWEETLDEDFLFNPGTHNTGTRGRAAYSEVLHRFCRVIESVAIKGAVVQGEQATVIATYAVISPAGKRMTIDIAEVWTARNGRLMALTIYFDTARWHAFMAA